MCHPQGAGPPGIRGFIGRFIDAFSQGSTAAGIYELRLLRTAGPGGLTQGPSSRRPFPDMYPDCWLLETESESRILRLNGCQLLETESESRNLRLNLGSGVTGERLFGPPGNANWPSK